MELYIITKTIVIETGGCFSYRDGLFPIIEQHICTKDTYWRTLRKVITEIYKPNGEFTDTKLEQRHISKKLFKHIITNDQNTSNIALAEYVRTSKQGWTVFEVISITKQKI